jgi:hypothetical protein
MASSSPHIGHHRLPKMRTEKRVGRSTQILEESLIEMLPCGAISVGLKEDNLTMIPKHPSAVETAKDWRLVK